MAFLPTDLGANLMTWWDATQLTLADNDPVGTFTDFSGNARHLTQATAGFKPLFKTGIQNGKAVVRFDGIDDRLSGTISTFTRPYTYCGVLIARRTSVQEIVMARTPSGADDFVGVLYHTTTPTWRLYHNTTSVDYGTVNTVAHTHVALFENNGSTSYGRLDGIASTGNLGVSNAEADPFFLGSDHTAAQFAQVDVGELFFVNRALTGTELTNVETYLRQKWISPGVLFRGV